MDRLLLEHDIAKHLLIWRMDVRGS